MTSTQGSGRDPNRRTNAVRIVAKREIWVRLTDKNFLVSTTMTLLIMLGVFVAQGLMISHGSTHAVAVVGKPAVAMAERAKASLRGGGNGQTIEIVEVADESTARKKVAEESVDAWLHQVDKEWHLTGKNELPSLSLRMIVSEAVRGEALERNAAEAGTTAEKLLVGTRLQADQQEGNQKASPVGWIAGVALASLFYMVSLLFGMAMAQSVVEEKQSRIVEIIVSSVSLRQLLAGKIVGNTVLAMAQMSLFLGAALIGLQLTPYKSLLGSLTGPVGWFLLFFLVGFVALACLWAVAGSLASRNEDLQTTSQPMMLIILLAFFGGVFAYGPVQVVVSFLPIVSSVTMPIRMLTGPVPWWEPSAALLIDLVFAGVAVLVGERAYRRSVLAGGGRVSWRRAMSTKD